jgi:hypothetical protein
LKQAVVLIGRRFHFAFIELRLKQGVSTDAIGQYPELWIGVQGVQDFEFVKRPSRCGPSDLVEPVRFNILTTNLRWPKPTVPLGTMILAP